MTRLLPVFLGLTILASGLSPTRAPAQELNSIHHCIDANGQAVFTDRMCADLHATPAPARSGKSRAAGQAIAAPVTPPTLCAASATELKQQVVDAFATRDANRLAGLMLWDGYGEHAVVAGIRALDALMRHPLIDIAGNRPATDDGNDGQRSAYDAPRASTDANLAVAPADPASATGPGETRQLTVETVSDDGSGMPQQTHFRLIHQSGCLWLQRLD
jgi:hypothetical protein